MKTKFDMLFNRLINRHTPSVEDIKVLLKEFRYSKVSDTKYFNAHLGKTVNLNLTDLSKSTIINPRHENN